LEKTSSHCRATNAEILFGDSSFIMRGERQRHLIKTNINIRMMIDFLSFPSDTVDEGDAVQKTLKPKCAANGLRALGPVRDSV
jgi:hypothetical protein